MFLFVSLIAATSLAGLLVAAAPSKPVVVAADGILCDLTKKLIASQAKVVCLIPAGADPHTMALTPADRRNLAQSKIALVNGYNLTPALNKIKIPGSVVFVAERAIPSNPLKDPHVWHDPANIALMANIVAARIKPFFDENIDSAISRRRSSINGVLMSLGNWTNQQIQTVPEKQRVMVTGHRAFSWFANRYGLRELPVLDSYTTGGKLRPSSLSAISKAIKSSGSKAIFADSLPPTKTLKRISRSSGVPIAKQPLYPDGQKPGKSLIQTATVNVCTFVVAQGGRCDQPGAIQLQKRWAAIQ